MPGFTHPLGDEFPAALLGNGNVVFFKRLVVYVRKIDVVKFHTAQLFQLFLDAAPKLERKLQHFLDLCLCKYAVRIEQFNKPVYHFAHGNGIPLIEITAQAEVFIERIPMLFFAKLPHKFRKIIGDEPIVVRKMIRPQLRNFPPGDITMDTI